VIKRGRVAKDVFAGAALVGDGDLGETVLEQGLEGM